MSYNFLNFKTGFSKSQKFSAKNVLESGTKLTLGSEQKRTMMELDGELYHVKVPHTRFFKNSRNSYVTESIKKDNFLATTSELISERKYKAFHFLTAGYDLSQKNGKFILVSKHMSDEKLDLCSLYNLMKCPHDADVRYYANELATFTLRELLSKRQLVMNILTESCYDKLIEFILMSVFEFGDDDHFNNIIFVKTPKQEKFNDMFVCDKESTVFNHYLALSNYYGDLVEYSSCYNEYVGKKILKPFEDFEMRVNEIAKLIRKGIMPQKYVAFLRKVSGFDFNAVAKDIKGDFGITPNDTQLDMFKYGQEKINEMLDKSL